MSNSKYILQTLLIESRRLCIVLSALKSRGILPVAKSCRIESDLLLRFTANYLQVIGPAYIFLFSFLILVLIDNINETIAFVT